MVPYCFQETTGNTKLISDTWKCVRNFSSRLQKQLLSTKFDLIDHVVPSICPLGSHIVKKTAKNTSKDFLLLLRDNVKLRKNFRQPNYSGTCYNFHKTPHFSQRSSKRRANRLPYESVFLVAPKYVFNATISILSDFCTVEIFRKTFDSAENCPKLFFNDPHVSVTKFTQQLFQSKPDKTTDHVAKTWSFQSSGTYRKKYCRSRSLDKKCFFPDSFCFFLVKKTFSNRQLIFRCCFWSFLVLIQKTSSFLWSTWSFCLLLCLKKKVQNSLSRMENRSSFQHLKCMLPAFNCSGKHTVSALHLEHSELTEASFGNRNSAVVEPMFTFSEILWHQQKVCGHLPITWP